MLIIPVMDLLDGRVVQARGGRRAEYAPIRTPLCGRSEPGAVLHALLALHPFSTVYIADLGALVGRHNHGDVLQQLHAAHPAIRFWLDSGSRTAAMAAPWARTVIGTESGVTWNELLTMNRRHTDYILSLDFTATGFSGDPEVLAQADCWPQDVILMHLPAVGAARGPDWTFIDPLLSRLPGRNWYLAGGIRNGADLEAAAARGIAGVLVATSLHAGTLDREAIARAKKTPA